MNFIPTDPLSPKFPEAPLDGQPDVLIPPIPVRVQPDQMEEMADEGEPGNSEGDENHSFLGQIFIFIYDFLAGCFDCLFGMDEYDEEDEETGPADPANIVPAKSKSPALKLLESVHPELISKLRSHNYQKKNWDKAVPRRPVDRKTVTPAKPVDSKGQVKNPEKVGETVKEPDNDRSKVKTEQGLFPSMLIDVGRANELEWLVREGDLSGAWKLLYKIRGEKEMRYFLPPFTTLQAMMEPSKAGSRKTWSPDFLRECAIAYPEIRLQLLDEDRLWDCMAGFPDFVADICEADPKFAFRLVTSRRHEMILTDQHRMEIFSVVYPEILQAILAETMELDQIRHLAFYLLSYSYVIKAEDFNKIKELSQAVNKQLKNGAPDDDRQESREFYAMAFDLVIGKLYLQGVYSEGETGNFQPVRMDENLIKILFNTPVKEIFKGKSLEERIHGSDEEDVQRGLLYLSLIPADSPNYADGKMSYGHLWMEQEDYEEAGKCFLEVARLQKNEKDALMLASMCLVAHAKLNGSEDWTYISRQKMDQLEGEGVEVHKLTPAECQSITLEELERLVQEFNPEPVKGNDEKTGLPQSDVTH